MTCLAFGSTLIGRLRRLCALRDLPHGSYYFGHADDAMSNRFQFGALPADKIGSIPYFERGKFVSEFI